MWRKVNKLFTLHWMYRYSPDGSRKEWFKESVWILSACYSSYPPMNTSMNSNSTRKKTTIESLRRMYQIREPISMITAHDYQSALIADKVGIDGCLVGDSLAMVALGHESTNHITVDEMLHHCRAVARGCKRAFLIGDLPFGSYELSPKKAFKTAVRFIKEGNVEAVKLEGGVEMAETIRCLVSIGMIVIAHIGLMPQRRSSLGGFRVQGKTSKLARGLLRDALAVQEAGASLVVLEAIPEPLAAIITEQLKIPTIGIGAGIKCSGQILVQNDVLGLVDGFAPKFTKNYGNLGPIITEALQKYHAEVKSASFPGPEHAYSIDSDELATFLDEIKANN